MDSSPYESLPTEILEKIFLDVPPEDISFPDPWVCRRWSDIVQKPNYWKKRTKQSNIIISSEEWTVLQNYDDKIASEKCLQQLCILDYNEKLRSTYYPPSYELICDESHTNLENDPLTSPVKKISEDVFNANLELTINNACAHILFGNTMPINIASTRYLYSTPSFSLLLQLLRIRKSCSENQLGTLKDEFSWWKFKPTFNNLVDSNEGFRSLEIKRFKGCLHDMNDISQDVKKLYLAIAIDERNKAIDPGLLGIAFWYYTALSGLHVHIKAGTDVSSLCNLPGFVTNTTLTFSLVGPSHINWVVMATEILEPMEDHPNSKPYGTLMFIDCFLNNQQMEEMLRGIHDTGIEIDHVQAAGPNLEKSGDGELSRLMSELWEDNSGGYQSFDSKEDFPDDLYGW